QTIHGAEIDKATWAFASPADTSISGATLWRAGYLHGHSAETATYQLWMTGPNENLAFDECVFTLGCPQLGTFSNAFSSQNLVSVPAGSLGSRLFVNANCGVIPGHVCEPNTGDPNGFAAAVYVFAADLTLEENAGPHASNASGELASAPTVQGQSDLAFDATDSGSGVWEALFSVDGQVVQRTVVAANGGRCRDAGQTTDGLAAFLYAQPCEPSVSTDVAFDTTKVGNGAHHLIVSVIDAAGNAAPVLDRSVTVANPAAPGAANGTNASPQAALSVRWSGTRRASLTTGFGRARTLTGRLTGPGGVPIGAAAIDLLATPSYAGAHAVQLSSPRTGPDGRFSVRIAGGSSSRSLRFAYRAHVGDALAAATRTLTLNVRAGIALRVSPHMTSVGRSIHFRGLVRGGPIPRGGKQLVLEARSPGSPWIEFKVVRTDPRGRYRASYRFKFAGPADYRFRARSEAESGFPFAAGASGTVAVHER
ncbi:MAG: hypothetical protein QOI18_281, partial [Solirubrobacteraceae bacterium]|nr:hypothetical protein [Solirubrobacteraceae bacterium]